MPESLPAHLAEWMDERMTDAFSVWWVCHYTHVEGKNVWSVEEPLLLTVLRCPKRYSSIGCWNRDTLVLLLSPGLPRWRSSQILRFRWEPPAQKTASKGSKNTESEPRSVPATGRNPVLTTRAEGPTAHLLPQFSLPQQPQQSSCSSPMKTNAGRNIWWENKQTGVIILPQTHKGQVKGLW